MKLEDTARLMLSDDYEDRLRAEYWQVHLRRVRLTVCLCGIEGKDKPRLDFRDDGNRKLLIDQQNAMIAYEKLLKERAEAEDIDLGEVR